MASRANGQDPEMKQDLETKQDPEMNGEQPGERDWAELPADPGAVSDAMLADALSGPDVRALVDSHRATIGETAELDALPPLRQKALLLEILHMVAELDTAEILEITDDLIADIVADPEAQALLTEAASELGFEGPPASLSLDDQRSLIVALVESGAIDLDYGDEDDEDEEDAS